MIFDTVCFAFISEPFFYTKLHALEAQRMHPRSYHSNARLVYYIEYFIHMSTPARPSGRHSKIADYRPMWRLTRCGSYRFSENLLLLSNNFNLFKLF